MSDPTEYDPNSKDLTDDPNFPAPKCGVCGVPWADHMGIMGVCLWNKALKEDLVNLGKDNAQLYKERDEARREVCELMHTDGSGCVRGGYSKEATDRGWDCFKEEMACDTLSQEVSQDINLLKGLEQAKEGKFSENPPMITPKKKK